MQATHANALSTPQSRAAHRDIVNRFACPDASFIALCRSFAESGSAELAREILLSPLPRTLHGLVALHGAAKYAGTLRLEFPAGALRLKPLLLAKAARAVASGAGGRV